MNKPWWTLAAGGVAAFLVGGALLSCAGQPQAHSSAPASAESASAVGTPTIDPENPAQLSALLDALEPSRVIMVGEIHDRYDHHLNQLAIIRGLHRRGVDVAVAMEAFQRPYQRHLDDYVAGRIGEREMLERTQWDERWRFDVALYRDILDYARANGIPLVALNAPSEMIRQVSTSGIDSLDPQSRSLLPASIQLADGPYRRHLEAVFRMHGNLPPERLQRFLEVQYTWDQTMARTAADYLADNPDRTLIVLAGSGHLLQDNAIPARLRRLDPARQSVLVTDTGLMPQGTNVDYVLAARDLAPGSPPRLSAMSTGSGDG
jgi:uncharacterized iron-regulated protein